MTKSSNRTMVANFISGRHMYNIHCQYPLFKLLIRKTKKAMLRITCRLTGNDVAQDLSTRACFIRVVRYI